MEAQRGEDGPGAALIQFTGGAISVEMSKSWHGIDTIPNRFSIQQPGFLARGTSSIGGRDCIPVRIMSRKLAYPS